MSTKYERVTPGETGFTEAVVKNLFKLMAIKDEYEVKESISKMSGVIFTFEKKNQSSSVEMSLDESEY